MPPAMRPNTRPVPLVDAIPEAARFDVPGALMISGVTLDSRTVRPGDLYAALPGHVTHGSRFAAASVSAGAVAIVTDSEGAGDCAALGVPVIVMDRPRESLGRIAARIYGDPAQSLQLLGVTGTNGKTTVATMVEAGLRAAGRTTGFIGTIGVQVDGASHEGARTTPEASDLQAILAVMLEAGVDSVVMEVSSIAIAESRVNAVRYDVAAYTNLSQDHLDYHGSMERYFSAKASLFAPDRAERGVVGMDDSWGRRLIDEATIPIQTWSLLDSRADWHAVRNGTELAIVEPDGHVQPLVVPMPGAFNVANAICAFAVLRNAGADPASAAAGIANAVVPGRMQVVGERAGIRGIVDYAHSPDAIARALMAAREDVDGRIIVVVGAGGDRDRGKRAQMGGVAARLADVLIVTDDNPRSEDPAEIRQAVLTGAREVAPHERAEIQEEGDRRQAITVAVGMAEAGDVVLVLGKGHEQGQESAGVVLPFDDATVLLGALDDRSGP